MPRIVSALAFAACLLPGVSAATDYPNTSSFGVDFNQGEAWYVQCMGAKDAVPPPADLPRQAPAQCDAVDLYYQARANPHTSKQDWDRVRECAFASGTPRVLMMLYANGFGVARNPALATRYACSLDSVAKAEMEARVARLARGPGPQPFDFCDDITSGFSGAICAGAEESQLDRARDARLDQHEASLPAQARTAFQRLRGAARAYARNVENDMTGTAGAQMAIAHEGAIMDQFLADVTSRNGFRPCGQAEYRQLQSTLASALKSALAAPPNGGWSTIGADDIGTAQQAWVAYLGAWSAYLAAAGQDPLPALAELTRRRTSELRSMVTTPPP